MVAKGYCTADDVGLYLGVTLTPLQAEAALAELGAVESCIDAYTEHSWASGPIAAEIVRPLAPAVRLGAIPVVSVESVHRRWPFDSGGVLLVADQDYQLMDPATGTLLLAGLGGYPGAWAGPPGWVVPYPIVPSYGGYQTPGTSAWLEVAYTPDPTVPDEVRWGAAITLAHYLNPHLNGITSDVDMAQFYREITLKLQSEGLPPDAKVLLDGLNASIGVAQIVIA